MNGTINLLGIKVLGTIGFVQFFVCYVFMPYDLCVGVFLAVGRQVMLYEVGNRCFAITFTVVFIVSSLVL